MKFSIVVLLLTGTLSVAQEASSQAPPKPFEKILGTWKQLPPTEPVLLKVEPQGNATKISYSCKQDGSCAGSSATNYDGKRTKDSNTPVWEDSIRKTGKRTLQKENYTGGKLTTVETWQLSPDGDRLSLKTHYVDPGSKDFSTAYDRAGGPVSKDDLFAGFWKRNWNRSDAIINVYAPKGEVFTITVSPGTTYERNCDGQDHIQDAEAGIFYNCRFKDLYTEELQFKKNGQVYMGRIYKISEDGKKMVATVKNAQGKTTSELIFERLE